METGMPFETGPYLSVACICEKVLDEKDGVKSAIRIVDRITRSKVGPNPPAEMEPFQHTLMLLVKMKSGSARGVHKVGLQMVKPSGERMPEQIMNVLFEGEEDRGVDLIGPLVIDFDQSGVHWFFLTLNDMLITKIPLRVIYMPQVMQIPTSNDGLPPD